MSKLKVKQIKAAPLDAANAGHDVLANAACIAVSFTGTTFSRRIDLSEIVQGERGKDLKYTLDLIDTKHPDVKMLGAHAEKFRNWMKGRALPAEILPAGTYMVPLGLVEQVVQRVEAEHKLRGQLVEKLLSIYDQLKDEAKKRSQHTVAQMTDRYALSAEQAGHLLDTLCDEDQYPTPQEIRDKFGVTLRYYDCSVPQRLAKVNSELHKAAVAQFNQDVAALYDEVKAALRESFAKLIGHLVERLTPVAPGEKPKVLRANMLDGLNDFLTTFEARNLVNDSQLMELVTKARSVLKGISVEDLKNQPALRDKIKTHMDGVITTIDQNLQVKAKRKIKLTEEE